MHYIDRAMPALLALAALWLPDIAGAQQYPTKPVRFIAGYAPGGSTDAIARIVAAKLQDKLGQTVIVDNRGGANGAIGLMAVKQSVADGYTFAFTSDTPMTVNPWLYKDLSYQPLKDFVPVTSAVRLPGMLAAHPSFPANSIAELIALAKEKPGSINYASAGVGNFSHLAMELFSSAAGVKLQHVPYKGTAPVMNDLLGGQVPVAFGVLPPALGNISAGTLRAIAVLGPTRFSLLPDVPTAQESGMPGFEAVLHYGLLAPAGTPRPVVERLNKELRKLVASPDVQARIRAEGGDQLTSTPEEYATDIEREATKWGNLIHQLDLKVD